MSSPTRSLRPSRRTFSRSPPLDYPRYHFFPPCRVLSRVFRGKFVDGLEKSHSQLTLSGALHPLRQPPAFASFLRTLFRENWVVYLKPPFGGSQYVLRYLAGDTHRVAISNHRLVAFEHDKATFRYKDYAHGSKKRLMILPLARVLAAFPAAHSSSLVDSPT